MIITVTSHKGGVGKTVTAVHLAAYLSYLEERAGGGPTLLVDGDPNRSAIHWAQRGSMPFTVVGERQAAEYVPVYENIVIDTQGRPDTEHLEALVDGCDVLIIPSMPDALALDAVMLMVNELEELGRSEGYKVLLTSVPPWPIRSGPRARSALERREIPLFKGHIRRREAFQNAASAGALVYEVKDRRASQGWEDYGRVGREVVDSL